MIVDVEKYLFVGIKEELDLFFEEAQEKGLIEFIPKSFKKMNELSKNAQDIIAAIKILRKEAIDPEKTHGEEISPQKLSEKIIAQKNLLEKMQEEKRILLQERKRVKPFGFFSMKDLLALEKETGRKFQFFFCKKKVSQQNTFKDLILIGTDGICDFYLGVDEGKLSFPQYHEMHLERSLSEVEYQISRLEENIKACQKELRGFVGYLPYLKDKLLEELNSFHLDFAKNETSAHLDNLLFSTEAWIPKEDFIKLTPLLQKLKIHVEKIAITKEDKVPTCMKNTGLRRMGEDLVKVYDIPSIQDKDPSIFLFIFFALFFSMIVADAGYGLLYLIMSIIGYKKLKKSSPDIKRLLRLCLIISSCCVVWGVIIGSYFGMTLEPTNPLRKYSLTQTLVVKKAQYHMKTKDAVYQQWVKLDPAASLAKDPIGFLTSIKTVQGNQVSYEILDEFTDNILIEMALLIGIIHIIVSLLRYVGWQWSGIGWVIFIIGGYLFFPKMVDEAVSMPNFLGIIQKKQGYQIGQQMIYIGISLALVLALIQNKLRGLEEPLKAIQVFADILSYLRIYALSLAGIMIATTCNQMGRDVGLAFGFLIIIVGHGINMLLCTMGGVIHGLRLNYLEWYRYSFIGGGQLFNPLKKLK